MSKPANLPFHLLAWAQLYVQKYNCEKKYKDYDMSHSSMRICAADGVAPGRGRPVEVASLKKRTALKKLDKKKNLFGDNGRGHKRRRLENEHSNSETNEVIVQNRNITSANDLLERSNNAKKAWKSPIKYIYYTESDQIVRYDNMATFNAMKNALSENTFFVGRRRVKNETTDPADYMGGKRLILR